MHELRQEIAATRFVPQLGGPPTSAKVLQGCGVSQRLRSTSVLDQPIGISVALVVLKRKTHQGSPSGGRGVGTQRSPAAPLISDGRGLDGSEAYDGLAAQTAATKIGEYLAAPAK